MSPEPPTFDVTELRENTRVRVRVRGDLDRATADALGDRLRSLRECHDAVLLDLDELDFIDASGLHVVLCAARDAANDDWPFTVTRGSTRVRRLFAMLDIDEQLPVEDGAP